MQHVYVDKYWF